MEPGRIEVMVLGSSSPSVPLINWYPEAEFQKKGIASIFKKNGKTISDTCTQQAEAWHCPQCKKVCAMLTLK
jgi:hypothetical protein